MLGDRSEPDPVVPTRPVRLIARVVTVAVLASALTVVASVVPTIDRTVGGGEAAASGHTTSYVALEPCRLVDQRLGLNLRGLDRNRARVSTDRCGIPDDAEAVVAYLTIAAPSGTGWLVAHPPGAPVPLSAQLNWNRGVVRGNSATILLGDGGGFDVFKSDGFASGNVVVDVLGAFVPAEAATGGRLVGLSPGVRLLDTREAGGPVPPGTTLRLPLPDGVPADAGALAVNVTAVDVVEPGFHTPHAAATARPVVSMLNTDRIGQFRAGATIVPVNEDGFDLYVSGSSHLVVDATAWFTGESAELSDDGLFVAIRPTRLRDTRPEITPINPGGAIEVGLGPAGIEGAAAVATSTTMVGVDRRGYTTAHAARTERGPISTGYGEAAEVTAQFGIVPTSTAGIEVFSSGSIDLTVDAFGWFTGDPVPATRSSPAANPIPRQRVLVVGDSVTDGLRRYDGFAAVRGAAFEVRPESCRRIAVRGSCRGITGRVPATAEQVVRAAPYGAFDILVMPTGYNDTAGDMHANISRIMSAAAEVGIRRVIWFTYSREFRSDKGGFAGSQVYASHNSVLRARAADDVRLTVVDWAAMVRRAPSWVGADGLHLVAPGSHGFGDALSRSVAHVAGRPCPVPWTPGGTLGPVCADPSTRPPVDVAALYPVRIPSPCVDVGPTPEAICRIDT